MPTTYNLSHHQTLDLSGLPFPPFATVNVDGPATLNVDMEHVPWSSYVNVNLSPHAQLFGHTNIGAWVSETIHGGEGSKLHVSENEIVRGAGMTVDTDVVGNGTFIVEPEISRYGWFGGSVEFGGSVSPGIRVELTGRDDYINLRNGPGLKIDHPDEFKGAVTLHGGTHGGTVDLADMAKAASWSFKNDLLSIADAGGHTIDKLHIADAQPGMGGLSLTREGADLFVTTGHDYHGLFA
jgi:hypothetical protein